MWQLKRQKDSRRDQRGITGLETAIVLIAFVMVASTFAYVVLSAGLFSSQKAREAVHAGIESATRSLEMKGNVMALINGSVAQEIYLTVSLVPGADPIDFTNTSEGHNVVVISYSDAYHTYPSLDWGVTRVNSQRDDYILNENELFQVEVDLSKVNDGAASDEEQLKAYPPSNAPFRPW
ncbi:MAG: hypothetical protein NTU41_05910 [Chloroflexi bacterium]|nr:hypothetical protein [Chloroflexota bacterium]